MERGRGAQGICPLLKVIEEEPLKLSAPWAVEEQKVGLESLLGLVEYCIIYNCY